LRQYFEVELLYIHVHLIQHYITSAAKTAMLITKESLNHNVAF